MNLWKFVIVCLIENRHRFMVSDVHQFYDWNIKGECRVCGAMRTRTGAEWRALAREGESNGADS